MPRTRKQGSKPTPPTAEAVARAGVQPPRAPTGLPQGEHQALVQAQDQVPVDNGAGRLQMAVQAAMSGSGNPLGDGAAMMAPTVAPQEPVTAGLPIGAGPGPEAVQPPAVPTTPDDFGMAKFLPMLEVLADRPDATDATRNFVRRIRGTLPPDLTMASLVQQATQ